MKQITHPLPPDGSLWYCVHCEILPLEEAVQQDTAASSKEYCRDCGDIGHEKLWKKEYVCLFSLNQENDKNYITNYFYADSSVLKTATGKNRSNAYKCACVLIIHLSLPTILPSSFSNSLDWILLWTFATQKFKPKAAYSRGLLKW